MDRPTKPTALDLATKGDRSPVRVSINISPAKQTTFVPSPTSPTKSLAGAIMEGSHSTLSTNSAHQSQEPRVKHDSDISLPQRHTNKRSTTSPELGASAKTPDIFATPSRSVFEPDSSDADSPPSPKMKDDDAVPSHLPIHHIGADSAYSLGPNQDLQENGNGGTRTLAEDIDFFSWYANEEPGFATARLPPAVDDPFLYSDWTAADTNHTHGKTRSLDMWTYHNPLASNPIIDTNTFLPTNLDDFHRPVGPTRATQDRLMGILANLKAVLLEEQTQQSKAGHHPPALDFDASFGSFVKASTAYSPTRPQRPHSDIDSFIVNAPFDESLRPAQTAPLANTGSVLKPPPMPPLPRAPEFAMTRNAKYQRSFSSPPAPNRRNIVPKHVHIAPPPVRTDSNHFKPPTVYTPFPFPKPTPVLHTSKELPPQSPLPTAPLPRPPPAPAEPQYHAGQRHSRSFSASSNRRSMLVSPSTAKKHRGNPYAMHAPPVSSATSGPARESTLTLFVRRRHGPNGQRTARIFLPRDAGMGNKGANEKHFQSLEFDDAILFTQIRRRYYKSLLGESWLGRAWRRCGSARCLKRIRLVDDGSSDGAAIEKQTQQCEEPDVPEQEFMAMFQGPKYGKGVYSWVHWAQRVAGNSADEAQHARGRSSRPRDSIGSHSTLGEREREEPPPTIPLTPRCLEFVEGWCVWRITFAFAVVLLAAIALCILWIFIGPANDWGEFLLPLQARTQRVGTACLLGGLALLLGWTGVLLWMGISWQVM